MACKLHVNKKETVAITESQILSSNGEMWRNYNLHILLVGMYNGVTTFENSWTGPSKSELLYDPVTLLLCIHNPPQMKTYVPTKTCTQMF